jgi:hypothetical protein
MELEVRTPTAVTLRKCEYLDEGKEVKHTSTYITLYSTQEKIDLRDALNEILEAADAKKVQ